jgi:ribose 5-phosphate isomerase A
MTAEPGATPGPGGPAVPPGREEGKRRAAEAAALLVGDRMRVGLGTGSTVAYLLPALARRKLRIVCVATSPRTGRAAVRLGLNVQPFDRSAPARLDLAVDGADQVDRAGWLVKGGGGAHTREKIVAAAADRFVVIVDGRKLVPAVRAPLPVELLDFGLPATLAAVQAAAGPVRLRPGGRTPDGGLLADCGGPLGDPATLAAALDAVPGVVGHGLFPPSMVSEVLVGDDEGCRTLRPGG